MTLVIVSNTQSNVGETTSRLSFCLRYSHNSNFFCSPLFLESSVAIARFVVCHIECELAEEAAVLVFFNNSEEAVDGVDFGMGLIAVPL